MTDVTSIGDGSSRLPRRPVTEFRIYYAIIFILALPTTALLGWLRSVVMRDGAGIRRGIIDRARNDAATIAPLVFSA
ncbi:MAG: cytochrome PufQ [Pseudomonadota bacterium]